MYFNSRGLGLCLTVLLSTIPCLLPYNNNCSSSLKTLRADGAQLGGSSVLSGIDWSWAVILEQPRCSLMQLAVGAGRGGESCAATDTSTLAHLHVASALGSEFPESGHGVPQGKEYNCYLKICTWKSKKDLSSASPGQNTSQGSPNSKGKEIDRFSVGEMAKHLWPSLIHHA